MLTSIAGPETFAAWREAAIRAHVADETLFGIA